MDAIFQCDFSIYPYDLWQIHKNCKQMVFQHCECMNALWVCLCDLWHIHTSHKQIVFPQNVSKCVFQLQLVIFVFGCKKDMSIQKVQDQFSVQVTWPVKLKNKNKQHLLQNWEKRILILGFVYFLLMPSKITFSSTRIVTFLTRKWFLSSVW